MTDDETAEIKQEIVGLETKYQRAMRECFWLEGQMFRLRQKLKAVSPEDCAKTTKLMGSNLEDYKEIPEWWKDVMKDLGKTKGV